MPETVLQNRIDNAPEGLVKKVDDYIEYISEKGRRERTHSGEKDAEGNISKPALKDHFDSIYKITKDHINEEKLFDVSKDKLDGDKLDEILVKVLEKIVLESLKKLDEFPDIAEAYERIKDKKTVSWKKTELINLASHYLGWGMIRGQHGESLADDIQGMLYSSIKNAILNDDYNIFHEVLGELTSKQMVSAYLTYGDQKKYQEITQGSEENRQYMTALLLDKIKAKYGLEAKDSETLYEKLRKHQEAIETVKDLHNKGTESDINHGGQGFKKTDDRRYIEAITGGSN